MASRILRSPIFVAGFLCLLIIPQLIAVGVQFRKGFRPFSHEPTRVPFSWDMFANKVQRCSLTWDQPVDALGYRISALREMGARFEWDIAYDRVEDYRNMAKWICNIGPKPIQISLHCFYPLGIETRHVYPCG